ncbi:histidine phosphatase family protein [Protofrankia sp. BMG5.30]|uniref:histidine phosphatase family protein n=1 Tax=Protofrankia TaxID=2994361 RepID=UPI000ACF5D95|nr:histidine phosphatase family protein [Protofrankia coriariae]
MTSARRGASDPVDGHPSPAPEPSSPGHPSSRPPVSRSSSTDVPTTVHLVRHGEVFNPEKVLYGRLPGFVLSEAGQRQAKVTAEFLAGRDIAAVVASPLERARQTAAPIAQALGIGVEVDPRLIESRNVFEGKPFEAGPALLRYPRMWRVLINPFRPSWGEPYTEIAGRMLAAVAEWRDAFPGREVVLVSHQLPVWTARRALEGQKLWHRPDRRQCALASVTSAVYSADRLLRIDYAEPNGPTTNQPGSVGA